MEREVQGHPPPVMFADRAEMYVDMSPPFRHRLECRRLHTPNTGGAYYVRQRDGTPESKRSINFTPSVEEEQGTEPITMVRSTNPEHVSDQLWRKLHVWVHNWVLQRTAPEEHQHLVDGVKKGGAKGLLVSVVVN